MFLRATKRKKDGKEHRYWSIVENHRVGRKQVVQKRVLYLGEINDSQQESWWRAIEVLEKGSEKPRSIALFPDDRQVKSNSHEVINVYVNRMKLERPRQWGACWLALELWEQLRCCCVFVRISQIHRDVFMKHCMDEKAKTILAGFTGKRTRSQLNPHGDLIWKLYQRECPFREIACILLDKYGVKVEPSTVFRFVKRLEQERSQTRKTRVRKEKPVLAVPAAPVVSVPKKAIPQSDEVRQRITALKQQKTQQEPDAKAFDYDPDQPLHLERE